MRKENTISRRNFLKYAGISAIGSYLCGSFIQCQNKKRPNILLITADDLNCDSVGVYGCQILNITPNIDRLASQGVRFTHAHITIAVCQPCRGVLATGLYPHRSGIEGFHHTDNDQIDTVMEILHHNGYKTGIMGKVGHSTPKLNHNWDFMVFAEDLGRGRNPDLYYQNTRQFIEAAQASKQPFYLMANSHDPHRPFSGSEQEREWMEKRSIASFFPPSRSYRSDEITVPEFLPNLPDVRQEIAEYYSSVRRCDDTVGAILRALRESGEENNTLVMFLSDNGMAFPFAKTNCYLHSTRTPWIVRWPRKIKAGRVDNEHFISCIDFMPTVLDVVGLTPSNYCDGFSFLPVLLGKKQEHRDKVFTQFHETAARNRYPMRCIQNKKYGYIFNPWSDGERVFLNESQSGRTFNAMLEAAKHDPEIASRVKLFQYRVIEEFYDFERDPDALYNLMDDPSYTKIIDQMRMELLEWMRETEDPALYAFENRNSPDILKKFMMEQQAKADQRPKGKGIRNLIQHDR